MKARWLLLLLVIPLAGCMSLQHRGAGHRHGGGGDDAAESEMPKDEVTFDLDEPRGKKARKRKAEVDGIVLVEDPPPPSEEEPDRDEEDRGFEANPHSKRAGTTEREKAAQPHTVAFTQPDAKLKPVSRGRRPQLADPATLSVAFVRDGALSFSAAAVLELESLLAKEPAIKMLASLGQPTRARVGLSELATQAKQEGWDLLLVDVREGANRVGYLLHTESQSLLARYEVDAKGTPVSTGGTAGLPERLAASYARLTK